MRKAGIPLLILGVFCMCFVGVVCADSSGKCGDALQWSLDTSGTLTITGYGDMYNYHSVGPWGKQVQSLKISEGVTSIGNHAFSGSALKYADIPATVTRIEPYAFYKCNELTSIILPEGIGYIGDRAFGECGSLTYVNIPASVTCIEDGAFAGCRKMMDIFVNGENGNYSSINGVLFTKDGTKLVCYPAGKTGYTYTIPGEVNFIGDMAFTGNETLETIHIDSGRAHYGDFCFAGCSNLNCVIYNPENPPDASFWWEVPDNAIIYMQNSNPGNSNGFSVAVLSGGTLASEYLQNVTELPDAHSLHRNGYEFGGWFDNPGCTSKHTEMKEKGKTVYAKWTPNVYTLTLDGNGETESGTSSIAITFDTDRYVPADDNHKKAAIENPKKEGYVFTGWYTGKTEGKLVIDADGNLAENVNGYTGEDGVWKRSADTTLYAHWKKC